MASLRLTAACLVLLAPVLLQPWHTQALNITMSNNEFKRIYSADNSTLVPALPDRGLILTDGAIDVLTEQLFNFLFRRYPIGGELNWQYEVAAGESVTVSVLWRTSPGEPRVRVEVSDNATMLTAGINNGSLDVYCEEAGPLLSRIRMTIRYTSTAYGARARDLTFTLHQNCTDWQAPSAVMPPSTASTRMVTAPTTAGAESTAGAGTNAESTDDSSGLSTVALIGIIIGLAALIFILVVLAVKLEVHGRKKWRSRRKTTPPKQSMFDDVLVDWTELVLHRELGKGAFGVVREGMIGEERVAVKIIKDPENDDRVVKFLEEAMYMKKFHHPNVLSLRGVCFQPHEAPMIIVPFMSNGDLHTYLNDHNLTISPMSTPLEYQQLLNFSIQVTNAMEYLASLNFVHRDLAARNCLLSEDLVLKVADFGLARDMQGDMYYRMNSELRMPVKWTALESINHQKFTLESDVWAYGVLLWEIMSTGMLPYPGIANADLVAFLENGHRLSQPARCPDAVFHIMMSCWEADPKKRPHFSQIKRMLRESNNQLYENIMAMPIYRDVSTLERISMSSISQHNTSANGNSREAMHRYATAPSPSSSQPNYSAESIPIRQQSANHSAGSAASAASSRSAGRAAAAAAAAAAASPAASDAALTTAAQAKALEAAERDDDGEVDNRYVPPHTIATATDGVRVSVGSGYEVPGPWYTSDQETVASPPVHEDDAEV